MNIHDPALWLRLNRATTFETIGQGVLHDLRSPLQGITMAARTMVDAPADSEMVARLAPVIVQASDKLENALDRLSGAHLRARDAQAQPIALQGAATSAVTVFGGMPGRGRLSIRADVPANLPAVYSVESHLRHAVLNLLLNAGEALGTQPDGQIVVKAELHENRVILAVEDNGPGVPAENGERVLEPFFTTKKEHGHLGLGLSVARYLVTVWGGSLEIAPSKIRGLRVAMSLRAVVHPTLPASS